MMKFSDMSRGRFVGILLGAVIFVVGAITISRQVVALASHLAKSSPSATVQPVQVMGDSSVPTSADKASFTYLVPANDPAWSYDPVAALFDTSKKLVKYDLTFTNAHVKASITQQPMPDVLKPRNSAKFSDFINSSKPVRSQQVGNGTVYFLSALKNGAPANGSDTIIYATDNILLFGRSDGVLGYDAWSSMLARLKLGTH